MLQIAHSNLEFELNPKLRHITAHLLKSGGTKKDKGKFGERLAKEWFERKDIDYYEFPQSPETMPISLSQAGGKRPDFMISLSEGESVIYVDAKFHKTNNSSEFVLKNDELSKFINFLDWIKNECGDDGDQDLIFMIYPQESDGDKFFIIHIDELLEGEDVKIEDLPAKKISLIGRDEDACFYQDERPQN